MRKLKNIAKYIFSLILAVLFLTSGLVMPGYSRSQHHHSAALNAETSWTSINAGLTNLGISAMAINPAQPATIYVGTSTGVFKTTDGGASWSNTGLSGNNTRALAIDFANPNIVHVGVADGGVCRSTLPLFTSTDGGASWSNQSSPADCDISLIVTDPTSPNVLYAGSEIQYAGSGGIILWKSTDGGANWTGSRTGDIGLASYGLVIDPTNSQTLYAPGDLYSNMNVVDSGLFKSTDGGASWNATGLTNTNVYTMAINPRNPNILYAGTIDNGVANTPFRGVLKSTDSGATWAAINNGLSDLLSAHSAIVIDPGNPDILYLASSGSGVFRSNDGGASWSDFNDGLTDLNVSVLALAQGNPNTLYAGTGSGVFKIAEATQGTNPIDDAQTFVRQQYLDFLGREPDEGGLAYWTGRITECGTNEQCINDRRIAVSAAFFIEQEFQDTGYFIYRFYKASLGRQPSYAEFTSDRGKVIGGDNLEANRQAFADEWTQRASFQQEYPLSMSNEDFVNKLFDTAQLMSSAMERQQEMDALNSSTRTRAEVLRDVIEIQEFKSREYNAAFVHMQYFGYLRRDTDAGGEAFWLDVLNNKLPQDSSGYRAMVCAFINSAEYQLRFSPVVTHNDHACGSDAR